MYTIFSSYTLSSSKKRNVPWNFKSSGDFVLIIPASFPTSIKDLKHFMENQKISIDLLSIHVESVAESFYLNEVVEWEADIKTKAVWRTLHNFSVKKWLPQTCKYSDISRWQNVEKCIQTALHYSLSRDSNITL